MIPKPSIFAMQIVFVVTLTLFHVASGRLALRRMRIGNRAVRRVVVGLMALLVLLLDLPLAHMFIFYKFFHPQIIDTLMHDWAGPFMALHANALLFGGALVAARLFRRPARRIVARLRRSRAGRSGDLLPNGESAATDGGSPAALPPLRPAAIAHRAAPARQAPLLYLPRRKFLYMTGMAAAGYVASASTLSAMESTDDFKLEQAVIKIPNLPEKLKGTTIAMISDVHSSVFMTREEMDRYVKALNGMNADIAIVVGDFVNSKLREVYPFAESFTALKAPLGVYGVTGNHDYYTGEIETVAKEVEQCGIKLIRNGNLSIEKNGEKLWLLGIDDSDIYDVKPYLENGKSERGTIENMLKGIPDGAPKIFLCHKPYPFEEYSTLGVDLMLSGHTHGGQVVIAQLDNINLSFASLASRYIAGLYKARSNPNAQLYVSRGVGTVGLPLRLNCPPEVTRIVLV